MKISHKGRLYIVDVQPILATLKDCPNWILHAVIIMLA